MMLWLNDLMVLLLSGQDDDASGAFDEHRTFVEYSTAIALQDVAVIDVGIVDREIATIDEATTLFAYFIGCIKLHIF